MKNSISIDFKSLQDEAKEIMEQQIESISKTEKAVSTRIGDESVGLRILEIMAIAVWSVCFLYAAMELRPYFRFDYYVVPEVSLLMITSIVVTVLFWLAVLRRNIAIIWNYKGIFKAQKDIKRIKSSLEKNIDGLDKKFNEYSRKAENKWNILIPDSIDIIQYTENVQTVLVDKADNKTASMNNLVVYLFYICITVWGITCYSANSLYMESVIYNAMSSMAESFNFSILYDGVEIVMVIVPIIGVTFLYWASSEYLKTVNDNVNLLGPLFFLSGIAGVWIAIFVCLTITYIVAGIMYLLGVVIGAILSAGFALLIIGLVFGTIFGL